MKVENSTRIARYASLPATPEMPCTGKTKEKNNNKNKNKIKISARLAAVIYWFSKLCLETSVACAFSRLWEAGILVLEWWRRTQLRIDVQSGAFSRSTRSNLNVEQTSLLFVASKSESFDHSGSSMQVEKTRLASDLWQSGHMQVFSKLTQA